MPCRLQNFTFETGVKPLRTHKWKCRLTRNQWSASQVWFSKPSTDVVALICSHVRLATVLMCSVMQCTDNWLSANWFGDLEFAQSGESDTTPDNTTSMCHWLLVPEWIPAIWISVWFNQSGVMTWSQLRCSILKNISRIWWTQRYGNVAKCTICSWQQRSLFSHSNRGHSRGGAWLLI